jgi:hypothetical protein
VNRYAFPLLALLATLAPAPGWAAAARRAPQALVAGNGLQDYFDSIGESIDVHADQEGTQRWGSARWGREPFVLQIDRVRHDGRYSIGIYDASGSGPLRRYEIFAVASDVDFRAVSSFRPTASSLTVNLFDQYGAWRSNRTFRGVSESHYGFYISGPGGMGYSQDTRQLDQGDVRMLVFPGTGRNADGWWLCIENHDPSDPDPDPDFDDTILFIGPADPTPTSRFTWGRVKTLFR